MKRLFSILAIALCLTLSREAAAQTDFFDVIPRHEFTINAFGGISTLQYSVPGTYSFRRDPQVGFTQAPLATSLFDLSSLGGGGGIGWNIHFSPHWGLMTGADFAIYRSAIRTTGVDHMVLSGYLEHLPGESAAQLIDNLTLMAAYGFQESQTVYAVQVPLMVKFMTGLGVKKANQFYVAAGARVGFNVMNSFDQRLFLAVAPDANDPASGGGLHVIPRTTAGRLLGNGVATAPPVSEVMDQPLAWSVQTNMVTDPPYSTTMRNADGALESASYKGKISNLELLNVMASAEIGFRWNLGGGCGLYTGLYLDYGLLPQTRATEDTGLVRMDVNTNTYTDPQSILAASKIPAIAVNADKVASYVGRPGNIVEKVNTFAAGLKLRLAFGGVKKKPAEPVIIVVRDTVTQTRVVRDTVTRTNTVVVRDTVTNVIRDTVTIIKEIPVEIQQTMMELSNTMFDFDKDVIKDVAKEPLNKVVKWLQDNPEVKVEISGHTDSKGSDKYNQDLSERRARAVYKYFIAQGVDKFRLAYAGYGKTRPIATNDTEEGRQMNRRVELNIIR